MFAWVPAGGFAWHLRIVVGVIAIFQGFQPGGDPAIGVAAGVLVAISYIAPAADRAWRSVVQRDADLIGAQRGLAGSLIQLAQWQHGSASLERVQRIRAATAERVPSTPPERAEGPAVEAASGAQVLTLPTARR